MKKLALVMVFALIAGSAFAQNWRANNVGVYLDEGAVSNCGFGMGAVDCYLVGTGIETATVGGFEIKLTVVGPAFGPLNPVFPEGGINLATKPGEWIVGFGTPSPVTNGMTTFMAFQLLITDNSTPTEIYGDHIYFPSLPNSGAPGAYLDGADYDIILPLYSATGDVVGGGSVPLFTMNGGCGVDAQDATWGEVKSLFR